MEIVKFKSFTDDRGSLIPLDFDLFPFQPQRIFIVENVPVGCVRGNHAHHKTEQFLICTKGVIEVILHDGTNETTIILNKNEGVLVPEMIWDSQKFLQENSVLVVICSTKYEKDDYILDFQSFKNLTKK